MRPAPEPDPPGYEEYEADSPPLGAAIEEPDATNGALDGIANDCEYPVPILAIDVTEDTVVVVEEDSTDETPTCHSFWSLS